MTTQEIAVGPTDKPDTLSFIPTSMKVVETQVLEKFLGKGKKKDALLFLVGCLNDKSGSFERVIEGKHEKK